MIVDDPSYWHYIIEIIRVIVLKTEAGNGNRDLKMQASPVHSHLLTRSHGCSLVTMATHEILAVPKIEVLDGVKNAFPKLYEGWPDTKRLPVSEGSDRNGTAVAVEDLFDCEEFWLGHVQSL